ncbi:glycosyltransferase family 2 protein [Rhabdochromatium marinum]|uniref:glycosyltransferase family 2 protein n=1 Tax=Rhabdochromatium marinum TaxID=48729 RepID=UPI00190720E4|nr:glycosyltransferase family 2 protein [Rhabdochromatium marinum]MBK1648835.1 hypothetical protein [Rhabdochromatium marinum]
MLRPVGFRKLIQRQDTQRQSDDPNPAWLLNPERPINQQGGMPSLTIITATHNASATVEASIASVTAQTYPNIEYIILDNASTDGTVEIIQQHSEQIALWISEPDNGIYDAMNKALDKATGDWIYFLGADDRLFSPETISKVFTEIIGADTTAPVISGRVILTDGRCIDSSLGLRTLLHNTLHHQGTFYHHSLFTTWRYNKSLKILSDYELTLKIYFSRIPFECIDQTIAVCGVEGASSRKLWTAFKEMNYIRSHFLKPLPESIARVLFGLKFTAFLLRKTLRLFCSTSSPA